MERAIITVTRKTFRRFRFGEGLSKFLPSGKACLENSLKYGGTMGLVSDFDVKEILERDQTRVVGAIPTLIRELGEWRKKNLAYSIQKAKNRLHS